ncbi:MAG: hypothetical protein WCI38_02250 [Chthoniobacterales bacterium]|jgi:DNA-binding transcriptional regulator GbsR (MarR family)
MSDSEAGVKLNPFQVETIALFVRAATVLRLPRSVAQIYGLLFTTSDPLSLDDIGDRLGISRGSTFDGIRWLRDLGAVEGVTLPGVRKEHFRAEFRLRTLATGFLRNQIQPHVHNGAAHIRQLRESIDASSPDAAFQKDRLKQIAGWQKFFSRVLPVIKALATKPHFPLPKHPSRS